MMEQVDMTDLKSVAPQRRAGSTPAGGTIGTSLRRADFLLFSGFVNLLCQLIWMSLIQMSKRLSLGGLQPSRGR